MIRTALATLVTTKSAVVFAATAAVTVGGVVTVTAATGGSGGRPTVIPPAPTIAPTLSRASAASLSSAEPTSSVPHTDTRTSESAVPPSAARSSPTLAGLCRTYTRHPVAEHSKVLESPDFTALITAAGGKDKIDGYCAGTLSDRPTPPDNDDTDEPDDKENPRHGD